MGEAVISVGEQVSLAIDDLNHDGDGVGRTDDGFVLFVPEALPGDRVTAELQSRKKSFGRARLIRVDTASAARTEAPCAVATSCGGCRLQHAVYHAQLKWKEERVREALRRVGGVEGVPVFPTVGMDNPFHYRNKAQYPVRQNPRGEIVTGFYRRGSHEVIPFDDCLIQHPLIPKVVNTARRLMSELGMSIYNEQTHDGDVRHIVVRVSFSRNSAMAVLVTKARQGTGVSHWVAGMQRAIPELVSIAHNVNPAKTNAILGADTRILWGDEVLVESIGGVEYEVSPTSFFQVNSIQTKVLYDTIREYADLNGGETVWDVYCGAGTIGIYLAQTPIDLRGVDRTAAAIGDARQNARRNRCEAAVYETGSAEKVLPEWVKRGGEADVCLLDPPRSGCDQRALRAVLDAHPTKIVYVSCNPSTLGRDLAVLQNGGYRARHVLPVDMFPHTPHVESVTLLTSV